MKVVVFGGSGFLGSYVCDELAARRHDVTVFDLVESRSGHKTRVGDLRDRAAVDAAVAGADYVYNFAGLADLDRSLDDPVETVDLNVIGNMHVLEACRKNLVKRFVYASSAYVFSRKGAFYGASKKCSEILIEQYKEQFNLDYTIIRYGSVYGERADESNRIFRILRQALKERKITFAGDGSEQREYIHGRDAARLSVDVLAPEYRNQNVILTGVERLEYRDLLAMINEILGGQIEIEFQEREYKGHYKLTPYSWTPTVGQKLVSNPCVDFGQGILECIDKIHERMANEKPVPVVKPVPSPKKRNKA